MSNLSLIWDVPGNIDTLRSMWASGASTSDIARAIGQGVTRNAIAGKAHRMKLPKRGTPAAFQRRRDLHEVPLGDAPARPSRKRGEGAKGLAFKIAQARKDGLGIAAGMELVLGRKPPRLPTLDMEGVDATQLIAFSDRKIGKQCAWIPGDPFDGCMCCGKPVREGSQWCDQHHARVYAGQSKLY